VDYLLPEVVPSASCLAVGSIAAAFTSTFDPGFRFLPIDRERANAAQ
jgi:hypothetical protein